MGIVLLSLYGNFRGFCIKSKFIRNLYTLLLVWCLILRLINGEIETGYEEYYTLFDSIAYIVSIPVLFIHIKNLRKRRV